MCALLYGCVQSNLVIKDATDNLQEADQTLSFTNQQVQYDVPVKSDFIFARTLTDQRLDLLKVPVEEHLEARISEIRG